MIFNTNEMLLIPRQGLNKIIYIFVYYLIKIKIQRILVDKTSYCFVRSLWANYITKYLKFERNCQLNNISNIVSNSFAV